MSHLARVKIRAVRDENIANAADVEHPCDPFAGACRDQLVRKWGIHHLFERKPRWRAVGVTCNSKGNDEKTCKERPSRFRKTPITTHLEPLRADFADA